MAKQIYYLHSCNEWKEYFQYETFIHWHISTEVRNHKLTEWSKQFVAWVESLPYAKELIMYEGDANE